ncbi:MAG: DUF333 domain-containing protein [Pseudorhodoplanes sp.]
MRFASGLVPAFGLPGMGFAHVLADPAVVFCVQSGGKSGIRTGKNGQYGLCRLPDGRAVDAWAYFRAMKKRPGVSR